MLTTKQQAILDFIRHTQEARGSPPSIRDIQTHFGFKSTNAPSSHLQALVRAGLVRKNDNGSWVPIRPIVSQPFDPILGFSASEVENLRGGDGGTFRDFMKDLIRSHMYAVGLSQTEFNSDAKNVKDGGCDAEVRKAATGDPENHFDAPTCWQFKGTDAKLSATSLVKEIQKPFVRARIGEGYRYVFCIAYDIPPEKVDALEKILDTERVAINPGAPPVRVYGADRIAKWCSLYPGIALVRRGIADFFPYHAWGRNATSATPKYVADKSWDPVTIHVQRHLDFSQPALDVCLVVRGIPGVGKTRFVYETVGGISGIRNLCLYSSNEESVVRIATLLAGSSEKRAIIIADECLNDTRNKLESLLKGHVDRVRVVAINNSREPSFRPALEPELRRLPEEALSKVLAENFPGTPIEIRQAALRLAQGSVGIASDLCRRGIPDGIAELGGYIRSRLKDDADFLRLCALSLFTRVGFKGEDPALRNEIDVVAGLLGIEPKELLLTYKRLKDSSGFVAIGGRFFYLTPDAVAQRCLEEAWKTHVVDDLPSFYENLPLGLRTAFEERIKSLGNQPIREQFASMVSKIVADLNPADLTDKKKARQLVSLVETNPGAFLAKFRQLIEAADDETIESFSQRGENGSNARRQAIWMCEHLVPFAEYYYEVEAILYRLAQVETEKSIGNNATEIWGQINRIHLSGSSVPFPDRHAVLLRRYRGGDERAARLCFEALKQNLGRTLSRMGTPPVVAGRIPPRDWEPRTREEAISSYEALQAFFREGQDSAFLKLKADVNAFLASNVRWFLDTGWIDYIRNALSAPELVSMYRAKILDQINGFLRFSKKEHSEDYLEKVLRWRTELIPRSLEERLKTLIANRYSWLPEEEHQEGKKEVAALANELLHEPSVVQKYLPWLNSEEAKSAYELGWEMAGVDSGGSLFPALISDTRNSAPVLRGYIAGISKANGTVPKYVLVWLKEIMKSDPQLAFHVVVTFPDRIDGISRALDLAESCSVPPRFLGGLFYGIPKGGLKAGLLTRGLRALLRYPGDDEQSALEAALNLADTWFSNMKAEKASIPPAENEEFWSPLVELIQRFDSGRVMERYYWANVCKYVINVAPRLVIKKACEALEEDLYTGREATGLLLEYAKINPDLIVEELGKILLNPETGLKLGIRGFAGLLLALPVDVLLKWIDQDPRSRAKLFAGSLPRPYVDKEKKPVVPEVTGRFLEKYGNDESVVRKFVIGSGVRSYSGDIAEAHRKEAEVARQFRGHSLAAIREWAAVEESSASHSADWWQQKTEEEMF